MIITHAEEQAIAQLDSIKEMVKTLTVEENKGIDGDYDGARTTIIEDPLSVRIRDSWYDPCHPEEAYIEEYEILLCTGGPAVRIIGTLDAAQPDTARIEHQDWGTLWTEHRVSRDEEEILLTYARCFYFGE